MQVRNRKCGAQEKVRPEFVAAIRYKDGSKELFHVRFANDLSDARHLVATSQMDVKTILLAVRTPPKKTENPDE